MNLFAQTLTEYLIKTIRPVIMNPSGGKEIRIFLASQPPRILYEAASEVAEFLAGHPAQIKFEFKTGKALWETWQQGALDEEDTTCVQKIKNNNWVDEEDKLTFYRNLQWDSSSGYDFLVIILAGVELARDQASLDDFFRVDSDIIWNSVLKKSFDRWIRQIYQAQSDPVFAGDEEIEEADELLKVLHKHGAGDLLQVADYLSQLDLNGLPGGNEALLAMYEGLGFWDLPLLKDMSLQNRSKWTGYIDAADRFFSHTDLLKLSERNKVNKKITLFEEQLKNGDEDYPLQTDDEFVDSYDLLSCLREYVTAHSMSARARLLKTDFAPIHDRIFKVKKITVDTGEPKTPPQKGLVKIDAPPLGAVLKALWIVLIDFKKKCTKKKIQPAAVLNGITLEGIKFRHDLDEINDGLDLIQGCIGGLDAFLEQRLALEVEVEGENHNIPVTSNLLPDDPENLRMEKAGNSIPGFQFKVIFQAEGDLNCERKFQWQLPETQPWRNLWNLVKAVRTQIPKNGETWLPVVTMPFYEELFFASDEEEANRILKLGHKDLQVTNLLSSKHLDMPEPGNSFYEQLRDLSYYYEQFLTALEEKGYFAAMGEPWATVRQKYKLIFQALVKDDSVGPMNQFAPLLYKAFSIVSTDTLDSLVAPFLQSAVVTGLHPALLEMMDNRQAFLIHGFTEKTGKILNDDSGLKITMPQWESVCDLASIKFPLFGLVTSGQRLDTSIKSRGIIHCVGTVETRSASLATKIILRADENDDEITNTILFRESRESMVVTRLLDEYADLYPHADDGISLAVINADNIQSIVAGIHAFLKNRFETSNALMSSPPYHFSLTLFTLDSQQQETARHLHEWRKRWQIVNETSRELRPYLKCRLSIIHRVANPNNLGIDDYAKLISRSDFTPDITMLINFITVGNMESDVESAKKFHVDLDHPLKFPIVEMPRCSDKQASQVYKRARVVSNRRFRLATLHSELGVYFKHPEYATGREYIVISKGDYGQWRELIDRLHACSTWVFCLDSAIDERLAGGSDADNKREIIGFSSGLGLRGELNYTISTECSSLADIEKKIVKQLSGLCGIKGEDILQQSAHCLVAEARRLSGLSLVRATGTGDRHIRELIAATLVRMSLPEIQKPGLCLCDQLVSLDAFIHWFQSSASTNRKRPDLLRIVACLQDDDKITVYAHIVECKLALKNSAHLEKARTQLESGLRHLMTRFQPASSSSDKGVFDQRYWWAQLERLIASKSFVPSNEQQRVTHALETLGEGHYSICWQAMAVAFWTDSSAADYTLETQWDFYFKDRQLAIDVISCGTQIIVPLCKNGGQMTLPCCSESLCFPAQPLTSTQHDQVMSDTEHDAQGDTGTDAADNENKTAVNEGENVEKTEYQDTNGKKENTDAVQGKHKDEPNNEPNSTTGDTTLSASEPVAGQADSESQQKIPQRIFLGMTMGNAEKAIFWEYGHAQLTNRHFLIFGKSGVGKTYAIQAILMELASQKQNIVIVDYTNGFLKSHLEQEFKDVVNPTGHIVKQAPLPINPFRRQQLVIDEDFIDTEAPYDVAGRITSVFTSVYSTIGEQQKALLHKIIEQGIELFTDNYDFGRLLEDLEEEENATAVAITNKLTPLGRAKLFMGSEKHSWEQMYSDAGSMVNIMQLAGLSGDLARMATEFILWDLYDFARNQGSEKNPLPIVLDEIQNLDHRLNAPLAKMLTEGRKFGISAILATQTLSNLPQQARDRLFMATHKLFFKPAETELKEYAAILANATGGNINDWKKKLVNLNKGECYSLGPVLNSRSGNIEERPFPIKIASLTERIERGQDNEQ